MHEPLWSTIFVVGIVHGVYLGAALLLRRRTNRRAARWLALLVAGLTTSLLAGVLGGQFAPRTALVVACLNINTELAFGPLLFLFVRSVVAPQRDVRAADAVHFLPFAAGILAWSVVGAGASDPAVLQAGGLDALDGAPYFLAFKACVLFSYVVLSCRLLARTARAATGERSAAAAWLRRWIVRLSVIPGAIYAMTFLEQQDMAPQFEADEVGGALIAALIFLAGSMFLFRPSVLAAPPRRTGRGGGQGAAARLEALLDERRPWLDADLSLGVLAAALDTTDKQLSAVINHELDTTFYALIGRYRLAEFRRLAADPAKRDCSVLELAFAAGFNSKASFYRSFRERYRTTPTAWRDELLRAAAAASQRAH